MAMSVQARMEHGRWLAQCPVCGMHNLVKNDQMVCTTCNPRLLATREVLRGLSGRALVASLMSGRPLRDVERATIPDREKRALARRQAVVYAAYYAQPKAEVERILRPRRKVNMNWFPHESLDDLRAENLAHGVAL